MAPPLSFATAAIMGTCIVLWVVPSVVGWNKALEGRLCMSPRALVHRFQLYRVWSSAFIHAGFFHILFNMLACYFLCLSYESRLGSFTVLYNILTLMLPIATLTHLLIAYALDMLMHKNLSGNCAVGISGVLFALLVTSLEATTSVSIFGFFDMPAFWYPPALALLLQFFSPGLSFLGHLSGIAAGHAILSPRLSFTKLSSSTVASLESKLSLRSLPYWRQPPDYLTFLGFGSRDDTPSLGNTVGSARERVSQWFSGTSATMQQQGSGSAPPTSSNAPPRAVFSGTGHVVGGQRINEGLRGNEGPRGGVPTHSRLLAPPTRPPRVAPSEENNV